MALVSRDTRQMARKDARQVVMGLDGHSGQSAYNSASVCHQLQLIFDTLPGNKLTSSNYLLISVQYSMLNVLLFL